jgi:hypothetical protein
MEVFIGVAKADRCALHSADMGVQKTKTTSVTFSPQANYSDRAVANYRQS